MPGVSWTTVSEFAKHKCRVYLDILKSGLKNIYFYQGSGLRLKVWRPYQPTRGGAKVVYQGGQKLIGGPPVINILQCNKI